MAWEVELEPCRQCREKGKSEWRIIGLTLGYHGMLGDEAQARRVSAALRATEGIPTDKLTEGLVGELRDALEKCVEQNEDFTGGGFVCAFHDARALLAKLPEPD